MHRSGQITCTLSARLVTMISASSLATEGGAWGDDDHRIVPPIAERLLNPHARKARSHFCPSRRAGHTPPTIHNTTMNIQPLRFRKEDTPPLVPRAASTSHRRATASRQKGCTQRLTSGPRPHSLMA